MNFKESLTKLQASIEAHSRICKQLANRIDYCLDKDAVDENMSDSLLILRVSLMGSLKELEEVFGR